MTIFQQLGCDEFSKKTGNNYTCQKRHCTLPTKAIKNRFETKCSNLFSVDKIEDSKRKQGKKKEKKEKIKDIKKKKSSDQVKCFLMCLA